MFKTCSKCKRSIDVSLFGKDKHKADGLRGRCRACLAEDSRVYRSKNRKESNATQYLWRKNNPLRAKYTSMKQNAKVRGIPFLLTREEFGVLYASTHCAVDGKPFQPRNGKFYNDDSVSIDRLYADDPYSFECCVAICSRCNRIKNDASAEELRKIADFIDSRTALRLVKAG